jgi:phosphate-selective porin OprO/OprP
MSRFIRVITGAAVLTQIELAEVKAQDTNTLEVIQRLERRIEELEQKVKSLESNQVPATVRPEVSGEATKKPAEPQATQPEESQAKAGPTLALGDRGFVMSSANSNFVVQLGGVLQVDSRTFFNDSGTVGNDGFLLRRARPVLQGTVFHDFDFLFVPDFGTANNGGNGGTAPSPQIYDAYLNYRYSPALQFQAGKFKAPIGLEQLVADRDLLFNERALPTDLVPIRDLGLELHGDLFGGAASYAAGIFSGVGDARNSSLSDYQDNKAFEGRLFFRPFKSMKDSVLAGFGFGVGGSFQAMQGTNTAGLPNTTGGSLPGYATVGQQQFFAYNPTNGAVVVADGQHWRISPQGYYYYGPFGLLGEYIISDQQVTLSGAGPQPVARLAHTGWEVSGSWVLTGEDAAYAGGVVPRRPFNPHVGNWGALQLVARYSQLDIDRDAFPFFSDPATSAHSAHEWAVGLNWYLNRNVKVSTSFSHTIFGGAGATGTTVPASVTQKPENVLFTRVQLAF